VWLWCLQPDGLLGQLHAGNLLGSLQVVIEAVVADVSRMVEQQPDANQRVGCAGLLCWRGTCLGLLRRLQFIGGSFNCSLGPASCSNLFNCVADCDVD
jgi:hypothetical protein